MKKFEVEMRSSEGFNKTKNTFLKDWRLYVLLLPLVVWFALFVYKPMYGIIIAFKDYDGSLGIMGSDFAGLKNFIILTFGNPSISETFWAAFRNTFTISLYGLIFGFPVPIILALLFSEVNHNGFRKITQTITYLPHFLSEVTITGILITLVSTTATSTGVIAQLLINIGFLAEGENLMLNTAYFRPLYIITGVWKESGYNSIVYFAAIMGISPVMYEALKVDGGSKWQEIRYVTIPGMAPTLIIMIIMRIGKMLSVGYERVLLLVGSNTGLYEVADVLTTFEIRYMNNSSADPAIGAAAGIFNSVIGFALVIGANTISRKVSSTSLW